MILTGYYLETTDLGVVQEYLGEMKKRIVNRGRTLYEELLRHEIEMVVDYTVLNAVQTPNVTFLEAAEGMLLSRMRFASLNNLPTDYNFNVSAHVFPFEGKTFIRLNATNDDFANALKDMKDLTPCHVSAKADPLNNNGELWEKIMKFYKGGIPMFGVQLLDWNKPEDVNYKGIRFHTANKRAENHARYNMENRLLNMFGNGEQIPGYRLMEFMDDALLALGSSNSKEELSAMKGKLMSLLPNITYTYITTNPVNPQEQLEKQLSQDAQLEEELKPETENYETRNDSCETLCDDSCETGKEKE